MDTGGGGRRSGGYGERYRDEHRNGQGMGNDMMSSENSRR